MADDTFSASDFTSAEASASSESAATATPAPADSPAPVDAAAQPGEATTQPAATTTDQPSTAPANKGPIPFNVHQTALDNARSKAVAEWEQQYGWAKQIDQAELTEAIRIAKLANTDPIAYAKTLIQELQNHPVHGQQLRTLAAQALAAARGQHATPDQEPQPDLPIELSDGRTVHLYSAEQQAKRDAFLQRSWLEQVKQEFAPVTKTIGDLQAERDAIAKQQEIGQFVSDTFQDVTTWPGMADKANQVAVGKALAGMRVNSDDPREVSLALNTAYRQVVLPTLHTASRQAVLNDINRQAAASTVNPAQTSTRAPKAMDDMSIAEALQHVATQGV